MKRKKRREQKCTQAELRNKAYSKKSLEQKLKELEHSGLNCFKHKLKLYLELGQHDMAVDMLHRMVGIYPDSVCCAMNRRILAAKDAPPPAKMAETAPEPEKKKKKKFQKKSKSLNKKQMKEQDKSI